MHQFEKCWGIEILESLTQISFNLKSVYENYIAESDPEQYRKIFGWEKEFAPRFEAVRGDMFQFDWSEADMIFANSTAFTPEMLQ